MIYWFVLTCFFSVARGVVYEAIVEDDCQLKEAVRDGESQVKSENPTDSHAQRPPHLYPKGLLYRLLIDQDLSDSKIIQDSSIASASAEDPQGSVSEEECILSVEFPTSFIERDASPSLSFEFIEEPGSLDYPQSCKMCCSNPACIGRPCACRNPLCLFEFKRAMDSRSPAGFEMSVIRVAEDDTLRAFLRLPGTGPVPLQQASDPIAVPQPKNRVRAFSGSSGGSYQWVLNDSELLEEGEAIV